MSFNIKIKPTLANLGLLPNTTTLFTSIHTRSLNVSYEHVRISKEILEPLLYDNKKLAFDKSLLLRNLNRAELTTIDVNEELFESLDEEEKSLAIYLNKVTYSQLNKFN
jgi:hypothetical protein